MPDDARSERDSMAYEALYSLCPCLVFHTLHIWHLTSNISLISMLTNLSQALVTGSDVPCACNGFASSFSLVFVYNAIYSYSQFSLFGLYNTILLSILLSVCWPFLHFTTTFILDLKIKSWMFFRHEGISITLPISI